MKFAQCLLFIAAALAAQTSTLSPGRKFTSVERLSPERLQAVRTAREALVAQRRPILPHGLYQDYRAVLHVHAEDSRHTLGKRPDVLAAAKEAAVNVVIWGDHGGPHPQSWSGMRDGVLFLRGAENGGKHELLVAEPSPGLRIHSHVEGQLEAPFDGWDGMEIYNRHTDAEDDKDLMEWLGATAKSPAKLADLRGLFTRYPDEIFGAGCDYWPSLFSRWDRALVERGFTGIAANDAHQNTIVGDLRDGGVQLDPYAVAFRNVSTHLLARELSPQEVRASLKTGRVYVSHDWLADPTGFTFIAVNLLGVYNMGDETPHLSGTRIEVRTPVPALLKLIHKGQVVATQTGRSLTFRPEEPGAYRVEAWLEIDGEQRPWIYSNALRLAPSKLSLRDLPPNTVPDSVEVTRGLAYVNDGDVEKQMLDVYRPKPVGAKRAVLVFLHGGAWVRGDRSMYVPIGVRFARAGMVTVIPSYRLGPQHAHPAQVEDSAAALAWTLKNIAQYGGDPDRVFIAGHSAGAHLAALLVSNERWLTAHGVKMDTVRGVMALSGVYDVDVGGSPVSQVFGKDVEVWRSASPIRYVRAAMPPLLVTYCENDYFQLPQQARNFQAALQNAGARSKLLFVPAENHISEIISLLKDSDATWQAATEFLRQHGGL